MLHDWFGDAATDEDRVILQRFLDGVGAVDMGRTSFEKNEGDGWGTPGLRATSRASWSPITLRLGYPAIFTFVTDVWPVPSSRPQREAGDKVVYLFGATVVQQALPIGLVDEIHPARGRQPDRWRHPVVRHARQGDLDGTH